MRVFLACPIDMDIFETEALAQHLLKALGNADDVEVITSKYDFEENFSRAGGWSAWIDRVVKGKNYQTHKDLFQAYVSPQPVIGRATYQILNGALEKNKPVIMYRDGNLTKVTGIDTIDGEDWKNGWVLTFD